MQLEAGADQQLIFITSLEPRGSSSALLYTPEVLSAADTITMAAGRVAILDFFFLVEFIRW